MILVSSALALLLHASTPPTVDTTVWAGHIVALGARSIPFHGTVRTRTDTYVLTRRRPAGTGFVFEQRTCRIAFAPVANVQITMDARAVPLDTQHFRARGPNVFEAISSVEWESEDLDGDGHPGVTIDVKSPICSGRLHVASRARHHIWTYADGNRIVGQAETRITQTVLGAQGVCLSIVARNTQDVVRGPIAYVPVPASTTCETLLSAPWPVDAERS